MTLVAKTTHDNETWTQLELYPDSVAVEQDGQMVLVMLTDDAVFRRLLQQREALKLQLLSTDKVLVNLGDGYQLSRLKTNLKAFLVMGSVSAEAMVAQINQCLNPVTPQ
ncbi:MAG: hypothetical protein ACAF41_34210 (plasmid) [Leptolyngbya sp. BL-A-14]